MDNFFNKLKIVDLSSVLAGPMVGTFFAELGAQVIKVENKRTNGDVTRTWYDQNENRDQTSSYFASANYQKKYFFLDLQNDTDYKECIDFILDADIVISNYKFQSAIKMKIDYETIKKINPRIIYAQINAYPKGIKKTAFDVVLQAETGYMSMNGNSDSLPTKMPIAMIDILAAHQLKEGILIALLRLSKENLGSFVETSLYESAIASLANQGSNYLMNGIIPQRMGSLHPNIAPYGEVISSIDGIQFVLAIGNNNQFASLCNSLGISELITDENYIENKSRVLHRKTLLDQIYNQASKFKADEILGLFEKNEVPYGKINTLDKVFEDENAKKMILTDVVNKNILKRVKTVSFHIS